MVSKNTLKEVVFIYALFFFSCKSNEKSTIINTNLPQLNIRLVDTATQENISSKIKKPTLVYIFSPECPFCSKLTDEIKKSIQIQRSCSVVMISPNSFDEIQRYYHDKNLSMYPSITIGQDSSYKITSFYKVSQVPFLAIYNRDKKLIKSLTGLVEIKELESIIQ